MSKPREWSDYELHIIDTVYPVSGTAGVMALIDRSKDSVQAKAQVRGLHILDMTKLRKMQQESWPPPLESDLEKHYPILKMADLVLRYPGKTPKQIYKKAERMKLRKKANVKPPKPVRVRVREKRGTPMGDEPHIPHLAVGQWEGQPPPKAVRSVFELCGV